MNKQEFKQILEVATKLDSIFVKAFDEASRQFGIDNRDFYLVTVELACNDDLLIDGKIDMDLVFDIFFKVKAGNYNFSEKALDFFEMLVNNELTSLVN